MSAYYAIRVPTDHRTAVIDAYPDGGPEGYLYNEGVSLGASYPENAAVKFSLSFPDGRELRDFVANILGVLIISAKARKAIEGLGLKNAEILPLTILDHRGKVAADDYAILNLLGSEDAIDMEASTVRMSAIHPTEISRVKKMVLTTKISPDAKMFRCLHGTEIILVREDARQAFEKAGLTGCNLIPTTKWDGLAFS